MNKRTARNSNVEAPAAVSVICLAVSWTPFVCLFAPFGTIAGNGEAWYVPCSSFLYLHAYSVFSPTVSLFGPERLISAAILQSLLVMFALQISMRKLSELIQRSALLVRRNIEGMAASVTAHEASRGKCPAASV